MSTSPKPFRSGVWISAPQIKTLSIENFWLHHCWPWLGRPDGSMTTWPDVSTVQSLVLTQQPLYPSSLRPPAASNESIHKLLSAVHVAHSAVWKHWRPAMHFLIPGNDVCTFPISGNEKTGPGMHSLVPAVCCSDDWNCPKLFSTFWLGTHILLWHDK